MASPFQDGRIERAFARRRRSDFPGLIPYFTAGYPRIDDLPELLQAAEGAGCLAAEVGIPFSDPLADGPTIQRTSHLALRNGITVGTIFHQIASARSSGLGIPVVLMTYVNPVMAYGFDRFCDDAVECGADGLIVPDLPLGESSGLRHAAERVDLPLIPLVTPLTTSARLQRACVMARGFVYCVSVAGITGARTDIAAESLALLERVSMITDSPRALGFGLSTHKHLIALTGRCEAAVVGSALMDAIDGHPDGAAAAAADFLHTMLHG